MKQIKTIINDKPERLDAEVNKALAEGWQLTKRYVVNSPTACFFAAELEREEITEAEKCCDNCKHCEAQPEDEPCRDCIDCSHWEQEQ